MLTSENNKELPALFANKLIPDALPFYSVDPHATFLTQKYIGEEMSFIKLDLDCSDAYILPAELLAPGFILSIALKGNWEACVDDQYQLYLPEGEFQLSFFKDNKIRLQFSKGCYEACQIRLSRKAISLMAAGKYPAMEWMQHYADEGLLPYIRQTVLPLSPIAYHAYNELLAALSAGVCDHKAVEQAMCKLVLSYVTALHNELHQLPPDADAPFADRIRQYVRINIHEKIVQEELAKAMYVSVSQLKRQCRKELGMTPAVFIITQRVDVACGLLKHTNKSAREIGLWAGFSDGSHFTKSFKRYTGYLPSEYRAAKQ
jgi:AraC-like DNA-binding protein